MSSMKTVNKKVLKKQGNVKFAGLARDREKDTAKQTDGWTLVKRYAPDLEIPGHKKNPINFGIRSD